MSYNLTIEKNIKYSICIYWNSNLNYSKYDKLNERDIYIYIYKWHQNINEQEIKVQYNRIKYIIMISSNKEYVWGIKKNKGKIIGFKLV